jgi:hypothetical protein
LSAALPQVEIVGETGRQSILSSLLDLASTVSFYGLTIDVAFSASTTASNTISEHTDLLSVSYSMLALICFTSVGVFTLCNLGERIIIGGSCVYSGQEEWEDSEDRLELYLEKSG